ncbi:MAG: hypothetical protein AAF603_09110 [Pseudomonadota bacterium]
MSRRPSKRRKQKSLAAEMSLWIDRLNASGKGMAGDVAVPFTLPGEEVRARVSGNEGQLLSIETVSSKRIAPPCPHFGQPGDNCGGCQTQHMDLAASLKWKEERLLATLSRMGMALPKPTLYQVQPRTRRRAKFALALKGQQWVMGFRERRSHRIIPLRECLVVHPDIFSSAVQLREAAFSLFPEGTKEVEAFFTLTDGGVDLDLQGLDEANLDLSTREALADYSVQADLCRLTLNGEPFILRWPPNVQIDDLSISLPPSGFLQATRSAQNFLQQIVYTGLADARHIADLFCGLGTFAIPLSKNTQVQAFDGEVRAITALQKAVGSTGRPLLASKRDLFQRPLLPDELATFDGAVLDPPRAGAKAQMEALSQSSIPTIVMVSCNLATLARDLKFLSDRYHMTDLYLVDQFLWSPHIEIVAVLKYQP